MFSCCFFTHLTKNYTEMSVKRTLPKTSTNYMEPTVSELELNALNDNSTASNKRINVRAPIRLSRLDTMMI